MTSGLGFLVQNLILTFPALQWMAAMFLGLAWSHVSSSSQNGLISSRGGGWWSSNGYITTRLWNFAPSYFLSEHLQAWHKIIKPGKVTLLKHVPMFIAILQAGKVTLLKHVLMLIARITSSKSHPVKTCINVCLYVTLFSKVFWLCRWEGSFLAIYYRKNQY